MFDLTYTSMSETPTEGEEPAEESPAQSEGGEEGEEGHTGTSTTRSSSGMSPALYGTYGTVNGDYYSDVHQQPAPAYARVAGDWITAGIVLIIVIGTLISSRKNEDEQ